MTTSTEVRLTCQCCNRAIMAKTGVIAHHGYTRPEQFWQTASCIGARHLPFEADRARLGYLIKLFKDRIARTQTHLDDVRAERVGCSWEVQKRGAGPRYGRRAEYHHFVLDRADFEAWEAGRQFPDLSRGVHRYEDLLAREVSSTERELKSLRSNLKDQQARYDGWKQTLAWDKPSKTWKAV